LNFFANPRQSRPIRKLSGQISPVRRLAAMRKNGLAAVFAATVSALAIAAVILCLIKLPGIL
jgi:hypothetical protein